MVIIFFCYSDIITLVNDGDDYESDGDGDFDVQEDDVMRIVTWS